MEKNYKCRSLSVVDKVSKNGKSYSVFVVELDNGNKVQLGFANFKECYSLEYFSNNTKKEIKENIPL